VIASKSLVQVNPTTTEGKYEISVSIDDLKADRPNMMKMLIDSGAITLPTVAVLAADSAVQTEIQNSLTRAGIQVKDEARLQQLRKRSYVAAMLDGKTDPQTLLTLKEDLGIDYIIVANAIVELTDFGRSGYTARALVRVKMMEPDTANFVSVGEEVESDEDVSGQIATEKAQKTATQMRMTGLLEDLFSNLKPRNRQKSMEITITGWASRTDSKHFVDDLQKLNGVLKILRNRYEEPILTLTIEVGPEAKDSLATDIESHKTMKKYGVKIQSDSATAIKGKRDSEKPVASDDEEETKPKPTTAPTVPTQKPTTKKPTVPTKPGKKKG
jgi:hypothetical protein